MHTHKGNIMYRAERARMLNLLRITTRLYLKSKDERFKEHLKWISDTLKEIDQFHKDGVYDRHEEKEEAMMQRVKKAEDIISFFRKNGTIPSNS